MPQKRRRSRCGKRTCADCAKVQRGARPRSFQCGRARSLDVKPNLARRGENRASLSRSGAAPLIKGACRGAPKTAIKSKGSIDLTALTDAEEQYRAGNPKPLANFLREYGLPKGHSGFVADVIDGTYKRSASDTYLARGKVKLATLSRVVWHYKSRKKFVAKHPGYAADSRAPLSRRSVGCDAGR